MKDTLSDYLKMTSLLLSAVVLFIALPSTGLAEPERITDQAHNKPIVLVLGDSLSAAYGLKDPESGWVALLQQSLASNARVVNASISGETSAGGLTRLPNLLKQYQPDFVIIELGGNDGLRGFSLATLRNQLSKLITQSMNQGAEVLLMEMQIPPNYGKRYTQKFTGLYDSLAQEHKVTLIPFFLNHIALEANLMQADGIHPTQAAQPFMRDSVLHALTPLLTAAPNN